MDRWGATSFASENFAHELGAAARTPSGDLTAQAIAHAYSAMGKAVEAALAKGSLVVAVGSFRSERQRQAFREIASNAGARATTLRIVATSGTAAQRIVTRGEPGPTEEGIRQIEAALDQAADFDAVLVNDGSTDDLCRKADALLQSLA